MCPFLPFLGVCFLTSRRAQWPRGAPRSRPDTARTLGEEVAAARLAAVGAARSLAGKKESTGGKPGGNQVRGQTPSPLCLRVWLVCLPGYSRSALRLLRKSWLQWTGGGYLRAPPPLLSWCFVLFRFVRFGYGGDVMERVGA